MEAAREEDTTSILPLLFLSKDLHGVKEDLVQA